MFESSAASQSIMLLTATAFAIGFIHTLVGPDHYLPFILMARARGWSRARTVWITVLCGLGHVGGSVVLGAVGIAFGVAIAGIEAVESFRGELAAWAFIAFGLVYFVWGLRRMARSRPHTHAHAHETGDAHSHEHAHVEAHSHAHAGKSRRDMTPWVLFTIFVFGPCEPLIPILMYPAATRDLLGLGLATGAFALATVGTMVGMVTAAGMGMRIVPMRLFERGAHALAGATILLCGVAIQLGL